MCGLCDYLLSQRNVFKVLSCSSMCQYFIPFYCQVIVHYTDTSLSFIYSVDRPQFSKGFMVLLVICLNLNYRICLLHEVQSLMALLSF